MAKLFTIALPVRNGGPYLRLCVESILAQTCGDFDLAILDNASTDGTSDYLAGLRDSRVRLYPADRPLSIEENWARILTIPKAEFLTTIGHDDLLDPEFLDVIARLIRAHPDAGLYATHFRLIDAAGSLLRPCRPIPLRETAAEFVAARLCDLRDSFGTGHVLRSVVYDAVGGIPPYPKLIYADDALFLQAIGASYRATALEEAFSYRSHAVSASAGCANDAYFRGLEDYARLLQRLQGADPALGIVLRRHFSAAARREGRRWRRDLLLDAYRGRTRLDPSTDGRIHTLASCFGETPATAHGADGLADRLLESATESRLGRVAFGAWNLQHKSRAAARRFLTGRLRGNQADQP